MLIERTDDIIARPAAEGGRGATVDDAGFLWIGIVAVVAVLITAFAASMLWVRAREEDHRLHEVGRAIAIAEAHVVDLVARVESILDGIDARLGGTPLAQIGDGELQRIAGAFVSGAAPGSTISFWRPDGTGRLAFSEIYAGDRDYFRLAVGRPGPGEDTAHFATPKDTIIGTPVRSRATGLWTFPMSRPLHDRDGNATGVVVVASPMETFATLYDGLRKDKDDLFALWRNDRTILVRAPFNEEVQSRRFPNAPVWKAYPAAAEGVYEAPTVTDGVTRLVMFKGVASLPLLFVYAIDRREISWAAALAYWPLLAIGAGAILAAAGYAALSIRYMRRLKSALAELHVLHEGASVVAEARGRFIGNMNHELRTPLNAVIGFSEMLGTQLYGPLGNPKYLEYVNDIAASGRHLLALIDDIMDLSAIDQGARQIETERVALAATVDEVVRLTEPDWRKRGIAISVGAGLPTVAGDARAVRQIVLNLATNAIKFSPSGARVEIVACGGGADGLAGVRIVDRGIGIEPAELPKVGTAFFRAQNAVRKAIPGTGLGLSIAAVLARKMGGSLTIESTVGTGTTATLLLPVET